MLVYHQRCMHRATAYMYVVLKESYTTRTAAKYDCTSYSVTGNTCVWSYTDCCKAKLKRLTNLSCCCAARSTVVAAYKQAVWSPH